MVRQMTRHKAVVATVKNITTDGWDDNYVYEWEYSYIDCFVQPPPPTFALSNPSSSTGPKSLDEELWVYTKADKPKFRKVDFPDISAIVTDWFYWKGRWYESYGSSEWVKMGRESYNKFKVQYQSLDSDPEKFFTFIPPFQEEYIDFLNSVGSVTTTVNIGLTRLCGKIEQCQTNGEHQ